MEKRERSGTSGLEGSYQRNLGSRPTGLGRVIWNRESEASLDVLRVRSDPEMGPMLALTLGYSVCSDPPFPVPEKSCVRLYRMLVSCWLPSISRAPPCPQPHCVNLGEGSLPGWYPVVVGKLASALTPLPSIA